MDRRDFFKKATAIIASLTSIYGKADEGSPSLNKGTIKLTNQISACTLANSFKACPNGNIFIGLPNKNPAIGKNQLPIYIKDNFGKEKIITQPIKINSSGYPIYDGEISDIMTMSNHSMALYDSNMKKKFYWDELKTYDTRKLIELISSNQRTSLINLEKGYNFRDSMDTSGFVNFFDGYLTSEQINNAVNGIYEEGLSSKIEKAAKDASTLGKLLFIPAGHYLLDKTTNHYGCIIGSGIGKTIFHVKGNINKPCGGLITQGYYMNSEMPKKCILRNFTITGEENNFFIFNKELYPETFYNSSSAGTEGLIRAEYFDDCDINNIEVLWSRGFAITATMNKRVYISRNRVIYSMRDGIRAGGCEESYITENTIKHCGDNAISSGTMYRDRKIGYSSTTARACIVRDNICIDSAGIALLGATNTIVSGNIINRNKSIGMIVSWGGSIEGANDSTDLCIENNIISDVISSKSLVSAGASNIPSQGADEHWNSCIVLQPYPMVSVVGSVEPGQYDYERKLFIKPETYWLSSAGCIDKSRPMAGIQRLKIAGNKFIRSLPDVDLFSKLKLGKIFTPTGWVDPPFNTMRTGYGIIVRLTKTNNNTGLSNTSINNNEFYGLDTGIDLSSCASLFNLDISNNNFTRINRIGVNLSPNKNQNTMNAINTIGYISIHHNKFDMDPYLEHADHNSNGTWRNIDTCAAIGVELFTSAIVNSNIFRNCSSTQIKSNSSTEYNKTNRLSSTIYDNTYICQPSNDYAPTNDGSTKNKGIRLIPYMFSDNLLIEDSDPQSKTYLHNLHSGIYRTSDKAPTTGWWPAGLFIYNVKNDIIREKSTNSQSKNIIEYIVLGWYRTNSGQSNILGKDWIVNKPYIKTNDK